MVNIKTFSVIRYLQMYLVLIVPFLLPFLM